MWILRIADSVWYLRMIYLRNLWVAVYCYQLLWLMCKASIEIRLSITYYYYQSNKVLPWQKYKHKNKFDILWEILLNMKYIVIIRRYLSRSMILTIFILETTMVDRKNFDNEIVYNFCGKIIYIVQHSLPWVR